MMHLSARTFMKKETSFLLMGFLPNQLNGEVVGDQRMCTLAYPDDHKEMESLQANATWTLVDLSEGQKAIGSKWVFAVKRDKTGQVERLKSRLVA
ncbi:uncharacterized mitochondrial protein AtMg00820-like [Drosophila sechellia]|uniref:uncharacterized mitochondrial protein AtMg00820-like n=1 Tax=Drosophila sechellia TaxID=7238 RepID=UPI0013DE0FC0|nr:uncharacterized mitochondrial protein AtMg00820-like [Drosophila sechellia]XP_032582801.1 uncharacterized mitochondrial protein AtMg00820-like [Drosophila sechellia]